MIYGPPCTSSSAIDVSPAFMQCCTAINARPMTQATSSAGIEAHVQGSAAVYYPPSAQGDAAVNPLPTATQTTTADASATLPHNRTTTSNAAPNAGTARTPQRFCKGVGIVEDLHGDDLAYFKSQWENISPEARASVKEQIHSVASIPITGLVRSRIKKDIFGVLKAIENTETLLNDTHMFALNCRQDVPLPPKAKYCKCCSDAREKLRLMLVYSKASRDRRHKAEELKTAERELIDKALLDKVKRGEVIELQFKKK